MLNSLNNFIKDRIFCGKKRIRGKGKRMEIDEKIFTMVKRKSFKSESKEYKNERKDSICTDAESTRNNILLKRGRSNTPIPCRDSLFNTPKLPRGQSALYFPRNPISHYECLSDDEFPSPRSTNKSNFLIKFETCESEQLSEDETVLYYRLLDFCKYKQDFNNYPAIDETNYKKYLK